MFEFFKKKLKGAIDKITKKVSDEGGLDTDSFEKVVLDSKNPQEIAIQPQSFDDLLKDKDSYESNVKQDETEIEEDSTDNVLDVKDLNDEVIIKEDEKDIDIKKSDDKPEELGKEKKKGFFGKLFQKISTTKINETKFDEIFWEIELTLLENNVAYLVIDKIKEDLKVRLLDKEVSRSDIKSIIFEGLRDSIYSVLLEPFDLVKRILDSKKRPFVILFVGINGSGKTTTLAKVGSMLKDSGLGCVIAASDTFRAAAIQQLEEHANNLSIKMIKHDYGSDSSAVAFDAIRHAESKGVDVVLIDSAGRLHSNSNLMDELKKLSRVTKPDLKIFVGESITGNDCIEQAEKFNDAIGLDAIILTKADIDEKGGTAISISHVIKKPILFLGKGQNYKDLEKFNPEKVVESIFG
ncbi:MAG TPA: signal recognition particle-docking protein FtsY [Candidatus Woesearchaeota archaeon]|nr:signal recognition particle-docking protein FtsY [Candidatus Woesearchaeota archaeon]